jgi:peptidoglycan/LPS O-acetylase OafA/YrhL
VKHRTDIDGLRALAVVPVVLFHANFSAFSGGYVGVDVFFVISGFLITSILYGELVDGRMSIVRFYERRVRRIFPALFAMLTAMLPVAAFVLMPDDLRALGKYLAATALFSANILFWLETNYFAAAAELNPLLHTWSLAVEEQFYILFPLLLAATYRFARSWLATILILGAAGSLTLSAWGVSHYPTAAFYLLPPRAWELLLGSLLAIGVVPTIPSRAVNEAVAWAGLGSVVAAIFLYTDQTAFPGFAALLPCLGAAALIHTGHARTIPARLLSTKPAVAIGLVSYSLYLWHWPLIVLTQYQLMRQVEHWERAVMVAISLLLAYLSWRFIERPFRSVGFWSSTRRLFPAAFAAILVGLGIGGGLFVLDGVPQRMPELASIETAQAAEVAAPPKGGCFLETEQTFRDWDREKCLLVANPGDRVLFWGDSEARQLEEGLRAAAAQLPMSILLYSSAGCAPVFDGDFPGRPNCNDINRHVEEVIKAEGITAVVLASLWDVGLARGRFGIEELDRTIDSLHRLVPTVIVIGQVPSHTYDNPLQLALRRKLAGDHAPEFYAAPINNGRFDQQFSAERAGAELIDPARFLCRNDQCLYMLGEQLLYRDNYHLNGFGSRYVVERLIVPKLKEILARSHRTLLEHFEPSIQ